MRRARTATIVLSIMIGMLLPAVGASASECDWLAYKSYADDFASTSDGDNDCYRIWVRHYYDPVWSIHNYWEGWNSTLSTYIATVENPELITSEHKDT